MVEDNPSFCPQCGAKTKESEYYCSECGYLLNDGIESNSGLQDHMSREMGHSDPNYLNLIVVLSIIWALIAFYLGYTFDVDGQYMIDQLKANAEVWQQIINSGITEQMLLDSFTYLGYFMFASAILTVLTAVLCGLKRFYIVALIACIIASLCALTMIAGIIGFVVVFLIYKSKNAFVD
ncbi:MAG: zinc ribbon domain-containing protein [Candidatus Methanomethylophilaceae archaeon]|nr:zinc ribbon domain-containing protein [Candidatus Methanomethylophilaceae archaeon]MDD3378567.1 zinc ribbon domain-containing protein [Candidatus Methanomethylophilaceae archaeon]MDY0224455.1 zinc ribbon domain-containing protein [Candidatus Methanomethylophilaceae archaeon]